MNVLAQGYKIPVSSFAFGGSNTQTGVSNFYSLRRVGVLNDEISNAEIIAKLESLRDLDAIECLNTSEARLHLKKLMSK